MEKAMHALDLAFVDDKEEYALPSNGAELRLLWEALSSRKPSASEALYKLNLDGEKCTSPYNKFLKEMEKGGLNELREQAQMDFYTGKDNPEYLKSSPFVQGYISLMKIIKDQDFQAGGELKQIAEMNAGYRRMLDGNKHDLPATIASDERKKIRALKNERSDIDTMRMKTGPNQHSFDAYVNAALKPERGPDSQAIQ